MSTLYRRHHKRKSVNNIVPNSPDSVSTKSYTETNGESVLTRRFKHVKKLNTQTNPTNTL